jgi:hypothetical protein
VVDGRIFKSGTQTLDDKAHMRPDLLELDGGRLAMLEASPEFRNHGRVPMLDGVLEKPGSLAVQTVN